MWQTCSGRSREKTYRASASSLVGSAKGATTTGEWPSKAYSILSPASKGSRCLGHLMPALVVDLSHRGQPKLRLQPLEPLRGDRTGPNQPLMEADKDPSQTRVESHPPLARVESLPPPARVGSHPPLARAVNGPLQAEGNQPPWEALSTLPRGGEEQVIVPGPTGTKRPCAEPRVESLSLKGLPIRSGWRRRGGRPSVRFMTG